MRFDFSIIIPTLNEEKFLPKILGDLCNQKDTNFEVIIVDAASSDGTKAAALKFKNNLNLHFFSVARSNVSFQRNYGASKSKGDYFFFLDADARLAPTCIKKLAKTIAKSKNLIFIPAVMPQIISIQNKVMFNMINLLIEISQMTARPFSSGGSMIFQRDYFFFLGGFDDKLFIAEDHEIIQRAKKGGVTTTVIRDIKVKVSFRRLQIEGRLDLYRKYLIATFYMLKQGRIHKKLFDYNMGGSYYKQLNLKKNHRSFNKTIRNYFNQLKQQIDTMIND